MFFDWVAVIAAALGGAVGGALGAFLGRLTKSPGLRTALVIAPALIGALVVGPLVRAPLERTLGAPLRSKSFDVIYSLEIRPALMKLPAYVRVFKDHPEVETAFKNELRKSYVAGGAKRMADDAVRIGDRVLGDVTISYIPYARDDDLLSFAKTFADILEVLGKKDAETCVLFLYGSEHGRSLTTTRLKELLGEARFTALSKVGLDLIARAADKRVPFDAARGQALIEQIAKARAPLMTGKSSEVVTGARLHTDAAEAAAACAFSQAIYADMAALPPADGVTALRQLFASVQGGG